MENEKRLIDANALCEFFQERYEYLRNASEKQLPYGYVEVDLEIQCGAIIAKEFLDKAKDAPAVDAVEVVRCKDCKYIRPEVDAYTHEVVGHWCSLLDLGSVEYEHFCSYGERREGE